ncbi:MAG TPA: proline dehydrogenase family protein [Bacteroidota bacterium]|nr:proline dehydrogenase family protein [Bacteroidota bacterium]
MSFLNNFIVSALPYIPKAIVGKVSARYIAGTTLEEALSTVRRLNGRGMMATLDLLGEDVTERETAQQMKEQCVRMFEEIKNGELDSNVSIKLSQLGLKIDKELCYKNVRTIVEAAKANGNFVRIDMEDSTTTTDTLNLFRKLREEGFDNVGVVIQAYLRRSEVDVRSLVKEKANIRLCKGIYIEPPEIAFQDRDEVRRNFVFLLRVMLEGGSYVGIATHDEYLIEKSYELIQRLNLKREHYEFQMLLGVREGLRDSIVQAGHRLRVYVPYGDQWYAYSVRRLKENPEIAGYVLRAFFRGNHR